MLELQIRGIRYGLRPDDHSWVVGRVHVVQEGKRKGEEGLTDVAYLTRITAVAEHLFESTLRKADAKSLTELVEAAQEIRRDIRLSFPELLEPDEAT